MRINHIEMLPERAFKPIGKKMTLEGGGGGQSGTSSTQATIAPEFKPLVNLYTQQATNLANTPYQYYGGQRYADFTNPQLQGMQQTMDVAGQQQGQLSGAQNALNNFMQAGPNPYLDQMVNNAQQSVARNFNMMTKPQTETAMRNSGSFGNSGLNQMMQNQQLQAAQEMGNIATQMYGSAYGQDRANQLQAIGMAPSMSAAQYNPASQMLNIGGMQQQQAQNPLDFAYQQFQGAQNYPFQKLQAIGSAMSPGIGSTTTSTQSGGGK